jgi:hypothetical protein
MSSTYRRFAFFLVLALAMRPLLAAGEPSPRLQNQAVAQATERLAAIDRDLDALSGRIERAWGFAPAVPAGVPEELEQVRPRVRAAVSLVFGLPWTEVVGTLEAAQRVERKLASLSERVNAWSASPPIPATDPNAPAAAGAITGVVTDEMTGLPLANTTVYVYPNYLSATSGADGRWIVTGLATGVYRAYTSSVPTGYVLEMFRDLPCWSYCGSNGGTAIAVTDGAITTGVDFSLQRTGSVTGRVTDEATGQGVEQVTVLFYRSGESSYDYTTALTAADGTFTRSDLVPGTYYVRTNDGRHLDELYDGLPCEGTCTVSNGSPVVVASGATTADIDFALQLGGTVAGTVTAAATRLPISSVRVGVWTASGEARSAYTGSNGVFRVTGLPAGTYYARTDNWHSYADQLYDGLLCEPTCTVTTGTPITVALGAATEDVDFSLPTFGAFRGRVLDSATGFSVEDASVTTYRADGTLFDYEYVDETGSYNVGGLLAGTYFAVGRSVTHLDELWADIPFQPAGDPTTGTPIVVALGQTKNNVDFALGLGGGVTGRVTAAVSGEALYSVVVRLYDATGTAIASAYSNSQGYWALQDLLPGTYYAQTERTSFHLGQLYQGISCDPGCAVTGGTPIPVSAGSATPGVDFVLVSRGRISGTATDATTGQPLGGFYVTVYDAAGTYVGYGYTDADGTYEVTGLTAGSYFARADASGYVPQLYDGIACPTPCTVTSGTPIPVALSTETPGVDFALVPYGRIEGTVRDAATGLPLAYRNVAIHDDSGAVVAFADSDQAGTYSYPGLAPGSYFVATTGSTDYVDELWENLDCGAPCDVTKGTPIVVALGTVASGTDFDLHLPYFADVPLDHWARRFIEGIFVGGITTGCGTNPLTYCPTAVIDRWQMAIFLSRGMAGSDAAIPASGSIPGVGVYDCAAGGTSLFPNDVPPTDGGCRHIHYILGKEVTAGCAPGSFCPADAMNRWQTAVFMAVALAGSSAAVPVSGTVPGAGDYDCTAGGTSLFPNDVPPTDGGCRHVHYIYAQGLTAGCGAGSFCPSATLTRDQMAVFLSKGFHLTQYGP